MKFETLKRRSDFLHVRGGARWVTPAFTLQARHRQMALVEDARPGLTDNIGSRVGFTVTKRIGNAVMRNRIKRRFREIVNGNYDALSKSPIDYVLIARQGGEMRRFKDLDGDFKLALKRVHDKLRKLKKPRNTQGIELPGTDKSP